MSLSKKWLVQATYVLFAIVAVTDPWFATIGVAKYSDQSIGDILPYPSARNVSLPPTGYSASGKDRLFQQ